MVVVVVVVVVVLVVVVVVVVVVLVVVVVVVDGYQKYGTDKEEVDLIGRKGEYCKQEGLRVVKR